MRTIRVLSFGVQIILGFFMIASLMDNNITFGSVCFILFIGIALGTDKFFAEIEKN